MHASCCLVLCLLPHAALPPNLFVLDFSLNNITGPIPSPLPQSMVYLGATEAALTGALPEVPANSSLKQVLLGGNDLEGAQLCSGPRVGQCPTSVLLPAAGLQR